MRTSVTLDEDTYHLASLYDKGRGLTLGRAIGELIQKPSVPPPRLRSSSIGFPLLPRTGRVITPEMIKALSEDEIG
jgi:ABC-type phosphate transport system auxiliary subunit